MRKKVNIVVVNFLRTLHFQSSEPRGDITNKKSRIYGTSDQSVSYDLSDLSNLSESQRVRSVRPICEADLWGRGSPIGLTLTLRPYRSASQIWESNLWGRSVRPICEANLWGRSVRPWESEVPIGLRERQYDPRAHLTDFTAKRIASPATVWSAPRTPTASQIGLTDRPHRSASQIKLDSLIGSDRSHDKMWEADCLGGRFSWWNLDRPHRSASHNERPRWEAEVGGWGAPWLAQIDLSESPSQSGGHGLPPRPPNMRGRSVRPI